VSKKVTRLHGEFGTRAPQRGRNVMALRPVRALDTWTDSPETGVVVIHQPKNFSRVESRIARAVRAQDYINRTLDIYGSAIWRRCDGDRSVEQIAREMEEEFHEQFEPAMPRTLRFIELLARRGLVRVLGAAPSAVAAEGDP
jgi:hypothetical protein